MQLKRKKLILKKEGIKENVCQLAESDHVEDELLALEKRFYKVQLSIFDMQMKIIAEEEKLYRMLLKDFQKEDENNNITKVNIVASIEQDENNESEDDQDEFFDSFQEQTCSSEEERKNNDENEEKHILKNIDPDIVDQFLSAMPVVVQEQSVTEMQEIDTSIKKEKSAEWKKKQEIVQTLNRLYRKRAQLRNKKVRPIS